MSKELLFSGHSV